MSANGTLLNLGEVCTKMESALDLLYAVYEAERQGNIPQGLNANAVWSVWDYMGGIVDEFKECYAVICKQKVCSGESIERKTLINRIGFALEKADEHELRMVLEFVKPLESKEGE